jgi:hypothetical protein
MEQVIDAASEIIRHPEFFNGIIDALQLYAGYSAVRFGTALFTDLIGLEGKEGLYATKSLMKMDIRSAPLYPFVNEVQPIQLDGYSRPLANKQGVFKLGSVGIPGVGARALVIRYTQPGNLIGLPNVNNLNRSDIK